MNERMSNTMNIAEAQVSWSHRGGMTWFSFEELPEGKQAVLASNPDLVYLELGTNGLDSYMPPLDVAQKAVSVVNNLLHCGVKRVIVGESSHVLGAGAFHSACSRKTSSPITSSCRTC